MKVKVYYSYDDLSNIPNDVPSENETFDGVSDVICIRLYFLTLPTIRGYWKNVKRALRRVQCVKLHFSRLFASFFIDRSEHRRGTILDRSRMWSFERVWKLSQPVWRIMIVRGTGYRHLERRNGECSPFGI